MRLWVRFALLALCFSTLAPLIPATQAQQDQPESKRKMVNTVMPVYPELAKRMGIFGSVRIEAIVEPKGTVKSTGILGGHPVLAQAAVDAVRKCKWEASPHETKEIIVLNFHP